MVAKNALLLAAFMLFLSPMLYADTSGMGDWEGQVFTNGTLALDGTSVCLYINGVENDRTTVGAELSGYYLLHGVGATGDNVTFKVFCEYLVNEGTQNWSASPPRHRLNISVNHSIGPGVTRVAPGTTGVAIGTIAMTVSTNESATCRYSTSSGVSYVNMANSTTTTLGTTHSWNVGTVASTTYNYYIRCLNQFNHSSDELQLSFTTTSGSGGGGTGGSGGGSGGGSSGGSSSASTKSTNTTNVDIGGGSSCMVTITREMLSGTNQSVLTTTLENVGGSSCNLQNFTFADTIPDSFPAINEITFAPMYTSREGWKVSFNFPTFDGGESKTITYTVKGWVGSSKVKNFTVYEMTANKKQGATAPTQPTGQTGQEQTGEQQSGWIPTKLPDIFGQQQPVAPPEPGVQPAAPKDNSLMGLVLTAFIVIVVLGGLGGLWLYIAGKKKRGL